DKGGETEGRFLLLRAQALPGGDIHRRANCLAAAAELGRRRRDMELVDEAVDLLRVGSGRLSFFDFVASMREPESSMNTARLNQVLKREKRSRKFPVSKWVPEYDEFEEDLDEDDDLESGEPDFVELSRLLDDLIPGQVKK